MAPKFDSWDDVVAFACALPDVEMLSFYGTPCPKLNGKALAAPGREAGSREADAEPDVTIVPDDVAALAPKPPRKPRKSATKVKANA